MSLLSRFLTEDHILLKQQALDWRDAIQIAGQSLLNSGDIDKMYIPAMQDAVKDFGPYIVLDKGFALAHAKPSELVYRVCISMVTLDPPVEFGNQDFDPVDILVAFGTPDAESHITMLRELCELLNQPEAFVKIRAATNTSEIMSLFSTPETNIINKEVYPE